MTPARARQVAADALLHLAERPDQLLAFLEASGLSPEDLRLRMRSPELCAAVLDHVVQTDATALDFARALGIAPRELMAAQTALAGPGSYGWSIDETG